MIQKVKKTQALMEMALFGTLILICFYYLLVYLQRMDSQQYLLQESFRSALKKASLPENNFVSYNIFSNRRQVSINSPLAGERSQLSASGQVYWGATEYKLSSAGPPEAEKDLKSKQYYKFNKDELDLTDKLKGGSVSEDELSNLVSDPGSLLLDLIDNGYIDGNGNFLGAFTALKEPSGLKIDDQYVDEDDKEISKENIYSFLQDKHSISPDIVIASASDRDSSTAITYSRDSISSVSRAGEKDVVTYTLIDNQQKDSSGKNIEAVAYTVNQALDTDGEYSRNAFLADRKVYNVMSQGGEDRAWTVPK